MNRRALLTALALLSAALILSPWLAQAPNAIDLPHRLQAPNAAHWLGTDELGRDVLARLLAGGRISLTVALCTTVLSAATGCAIGLWAGWRGGFWDALLMRLTDGMMALPLLPLLIVLAALDPKRLGLSALWENSEAFAVARLIVILAVVGWTATARLVRVQTQSLKARDHVRAAIALGVSAPRILGRHVLPHLRPALLVAASSSMGSVILTESALSFLGLGVRPPMASWGNMLSGAMDVVWTAPLLTLWPGLAVFLTVLAFSRLGDSLQHS